MKKRSLLLGLSLMTAVSPVSLLAGPGHGNDDQSEGFFTRLKNAFFEVEGPVLTSTWVVFTLLGPPERPRNPVF